MSDEFCVDISSFRQSRTLLRHCCPKRQHCRTKWRPWDWEVIRLSVWTLTSFQLMTEVFQHLSRQWIHQTTKSSTDALKELWTDNTGCLKVKLRRLAAKTINIKLQVPEGKCLWPIYVTNIYLQHTQQLLFFLIFLIFFYLELFV